MAFCRHASVSLFLRLCCVFLPSREVASSRYHADERAPEADGINLLQNQVLTLKDNEAIEIDRVDQLPALSHTVQTGSPEAMRPNAMSELAADSQHGEYGDEDPQRLYGRPKVGLAADWKPHDVDEVDASCNLLMLNTWHYQSSPLLCSSGGYDRCPSSVRCGDPFWSKEFVVSITEHFHNITMSPSMRVEEMYDVVMLDWDANNFFISEKDEVIKTAPHQSRSSLTMEASQLHPMIEQTNYARNHFDFSYGFHNGLMTEQTSYLVSDPRLLYDGPFVPFEERELRALVTTCIGTVTGERGPWVLALGEKVSTHHLCALGSNTSSRAPPSARIPEPTFDLKFRFSSDGPREKVKRFGHYKFCVAYENAVEEGYATEKLFDALRAGCIPIYKGAPDVKSIWHYADESILFVDDYPTMDALVARIHQIAANKTLWESFFAWKRKPVPQPVMQHLFHGLGNVACRACARHWQKRPSYDTVDVLQRTRPDIPDWWRRDARILAAGVNSTSWKTSGAYFSGP